MEERAKNARNEYHRKWRAENKEKVKRYNENYWNRVAERLTAAKEDEQCRE